MDNLEERVGNVETKVHVDSGHLDVIDNRVLHLTGKIDGLVEKVDRIEATIKSEFMEMRMILRTISMKLDRIEMKVADHEARLLSAGI